MLKIHYRNDDMIISNKFRNNYEKNYRKHTIYFTNVASMRQDFKIFFGDIVLAMNMQLFVDNPLATVSNEDTFQVILK